MLNIKKTKILSKASLYETAEGRMPIKFNNYCTEESLLKRLSRNVPAGSLLYLLLLIIAVIVFKDWFINLSFSIGTTGIIILAAAVMVYFVALYCLISNAIISFKYKNVRSSLLKYRLHIRHLNKIYEAEEQSAAEKETLE